MDERSVTAGIIRTEEDKLLFELSIPFGEADMVVKLDPEAATELRASLAEYLEFVEKEEALKPIAEG